MSFISESNVIASKLRSRSRTLKGPSATFNAPFILIDRVEVQRATGISRSKLYEMLNPSSPRYDPTFPLPLRVGTRNVAWREDELQQWMSNLPRANYGDALDDEGDAE